MAQAIIDADKRPEIWLSHGRTYSEQRYSPLKQINADTVSGCLGIAWTATLDTNRGMEATPIVVDGVMYLTSAWSVAYAYDAKTGERLWKFDPKVDKSRGVSACCDVVNRGVAIWEGMVYVGTIDGRLIALDAKTGVTEEVGAGDAVDQITVKPYTITGAPRVIKGKVIIGNGGAEFGVRGYISAYDAKTGKMAWRFYTTPNPNKQPDNAASDKILRRRRPTPPGATAASGPKPAAAARRGTAWPTIPSSTSSMSASATARPGTERRDPVGGDNLFLSSILALKPDTGEYVWHYQTTPGETWDYTATQHIILADLKIGGRR
jgi:quinohemoprotein ethanol dehydrogenase